MSALEIIAAVVLCIIGFCTIFIWGQVVILIDRIYIRNKAEKTPATPTKVAEKNNHSGCDDFPAKG